MDISVNVNQSYNTQAMVDATVNAAKAPAATLRRNQAALQTKISALGQFRSSLDALGSATSAFSTATDKTAALQNFVNAFNSAVKTAKTLTGTVGARGPLAGESSLRDAVNKLDGNVLGNYSGDTLRNLGLSLQKDGTLSFDQTQFDVSSETDTAGAAMDTIASTTRALTVTGGALASRQDGLTKRSDDLGERADAIDEKANRMRAQLARTYAQVDANTSKWGSLAFMLTAVSTR